MKNYFRLFLGYKKPAAIAGALILVGLASWGMRIYAERTSDAYCPCNSFALTPIELAEKTQLAQRGDRQAMGDLLNYYYLYKEDVAAGLYWMEQIADAGDGHYREFIVERYLEDSSLGKREYAVFLKHKWDMDAEASASQGTMECNGIAPHERVVRSGKSSGHPSSLR